MRTVQFLLGLMGIGGLASRLSALPGDQLPVAPDQPTASLASIAVPESLSSIALLGKVAIEANFSAWQEDFALPLVHKNCKPSQHGAESLQRATALGIRQHLWPFVREIAARSRALPVKMSQDHCPCAQLQRANDIN